MICKDGQTWPQAIERIGRTAKKEPAPLRLRSGISALFQLGDVALVHLQRNGRLDGRLAGSEKGFVVGSEGLYTLYV